MDEETRRRELVEKALREAGWPVVDFINGRTYDTAAVREYETATGAREKPEIIRYSRRLGLKMWNRNSRKGIGLAILLSIVVIAIVIGMVAT